MGRPVTRRPSSSVTRLPRASASRGLELATLPLAWFFIAFMTARVPQTPRLVEILLEPPQGLLQRLALPHLNRNHRSHLLTTASFAHCHRLARPRTKTPPKNSVPPTRAVPRASSDRYTQPCCMSRQRPCAGGARSASAPNTRFITAAKALGGSCGRISWSSCHRTELPRPPFRTRQHPTQLHQECRAQAPPRQLGATMPNYEATKGQGVHIGFGVAGNTPPGRVAYTRHGMQPANAGRRFRGDEATCRH